MKRITLIMLLLLSVSIVFGSATVSGDLSRPATATVNLDLNNKDNYPSTVEIGFTDNASLENNKFVDNAPTAVNSYKLTVGGTSVPQGALDKGMYLYWKITYPTALELKLKADGAMKGAGESSTNTINWEITLGAITRTPEPGSSTVAAIPTQTTIGGTGITGVTYNEITAYTHKASDTIYVDHGYAPITIKTQNLDTVKKDNYTGTLTLSVEVKQ